jgi:hypothetical protein
LPKAQFLEDVALKTRYVWPGFTVLEGLLEFECIDRSLWIYEATPFATAESGIINRDIAVLFHL